ARAPVLGWERASVSPNVDAARGGGASARPGGARTSTYAPARPARGGSLTAVMSDGTSARPRADFHTEVLRMQKAINAVADCRTPTIASIHGWCIGGGVGLISAGGIPDARPPAQISGRGGEVAIVPGVGRPSPPP